MLRRSLLSLAVAFSASANAYMFEGTYTFYSSSSETKVNGDKSGDSDTEGHLVDLRVYLQDVDVNKGAWDEAAFLNKASFVRGAYSGDKLTFDGVSGELKDNSYAIGGHAVVNDFIVNGNISTSKDNFDNRRQSSSFGFGAYLNNYHTLTGEVSFMKDDLVDSDTYRLGVNYHGYLPVGTSEQSMAFDASLYFDSSSYSDSNIESTAIMFVPRFTYYPFPQFGVGANLLVRSGTVTEKDAPDADSTSANVGIFAHYYPVEQFRIGIDLIASSNETERGSDKFEGDGSTAAFNVRVRF